MEAAPTAAPATEMNTRDVGIALGEAMIGRTFHSFDWNMAVPEIAPTGARMVTEVDVSDASNPLVTMETGEVFRITITRFR